MPDGARWNRDSKIVTAGPVQAYWPNPANLPVAGVRGYFSATRHGGTVPDGIRATTGHVIGLQLETFEYRPGPQGWRPVPGTRRLRSAQRSPQWFARELDTTHRIETGILMKLAVPRVTGSRHADDGRLARGRRPESGEEL